MEAQAPRFGEAQAPRVNGCSASMDALPVLANGEAYQK